VTESPIEQLLAATDRLDIEAVMALAAPEGRILTVDGRRGQGKEAVRELLTDFFAGVRSTRHRITAQWHQENVWIAEVEATYVLEDWLELDALPRVFVLRQGPDGIIDLRVYGAHELPLSQRPADEAGLRIGERWIPPL
jgi:SnoaL-like protein